MTDFRERVTKEYARLFSAAVELTGIATKLLTIRPTTSLERTVRYMTAAMTNSNVGVALLCVNGHGADGVKVARGMFETLVTLKYLILTPSELRDFLEFDAVVRWKRLNFYKDHHPETYKRFPESKVAEVNRAFRRSRKRFAGRSGTLRDRWCRHSIAEMARRTGMSELYELFYRYASSLHHVNPMGLGMLIDGDTFDVQPAPSMAHIGIALGSGNVILLDALRDYGTIRQLDNEGTLKQIEQLLKKADFTSGNAVISSLEQVIPFEG